MSVLAHVVLGGALQNEPAATQALAYILNSEPDIARTFVGMLRDADIEFEPGRIEAELEHEEAQPDLTIYDSAGSARVFVENKFWAGLTDAQPLSYLDHLPEDPSSALIFIVPEQRVSAVWRELRDRCDKAGREWADGSGNRSMECARVDGKAMSIISWKAVLEGLLHAARSGGYTTTGDDIVQLQGLASQMDREAFLPLRDDEVTDQEAACRLINYVDLFDPIVDELVSNHPANKKLGVGGNSHLTGRYFVVRDEFQLWLGVAPKLWRDSGITPLWCQFKRLDSEAGITKDQFRANPELIAGAQFDGKGQLFVPIRLKTGVERDRVMDDAVVQIERVVDILLEASPEVSQT